MDMLQKYYFIYKTTNTVNGKFYIGKHETMKIEDGYLGSGNLLIAAIKKYGKDVFKREILEFLSDRTSLNAREREVISKNFLEENRKMCYNIATGGWGGIPDNFSRNIPPKDLAMKAAKTLKSDPIKLATRNAKISLKTKERYKINPEKFIGGVSNNGKRKETDIGIQRQLAARKIKTEAKHILWKQQVSECLDQNMQRPEILLKLNHLSSSTIDRVLRIIREEK